MFARAAVAIVILLAVIPPSASGAEAWISAPNRVPQFTEFSTPVIVPGTSDTFNFTLVNRYPFPMLGVELSIDVYKYATLELAKEIDQVDRPPEIREGSGTSYRLPLGTPLAPGQRYPVLFRLTTDRETPQGTYFVRTMMTFSVNATPVVMKSRGHFTDDVWERATNSPGNGTVAGINLTVLQVDGILVDSSFTVREPIPIWPLALLIGLAVLFGGLAIVFYLVEEEPGHPIVKRYFYRLAGKLKAERRLREQDRADRLRLASLPPPEPPVAGTPSPAEPTSRKE